jgi:DNA-binding MarR family transcriptional regulator
MTAPHDSLADAAKAMALYRDNVARHIIGVARDCQAGIMQRLANRHGHRRLRLGFEPYISLLAARDMRLSELANTLGISRQAVNQVIDQIEAAGYVRRTPDPLDGRAKRVQLTAAGQSLLDDGVRVAGEQEGAYAALVGRRALDALRADCHVLTSRLGITLYGVPDGPAPHPLATTLPRLAGYVSERLMNMTMARGHPDLKLSFGQVLTLIGPAGGRISQMARVQDVSKQAISAIALELVQLGYLYRSPDTGDARHMVLAFTPEGEALIADSVASLSELAGEMCRAVGPSTWGRMQGSLAALYGHLQVEKEIFEPGEQETLQALASRLQRKLGRREARALGRLLVAEHNL